MQNTRNGTPSASKLQRYFLLQFSGRRHLENSKLAAYKVHMRHTHYSLLAHIHKHTRLQTWTHRLRRRIRDSSPAGPLREKSSGSRSFLSVACTACLLHTSSTANFCESGKYLVLRTNSTQKHALQCRELKSCACNTHNSGLRNYKSQTNSATGVNSIPESAIEDFLVGWNKTLRTDSCAVGDTVLMDLL